MSTAIYRPGGIFILASIPSQASLRLEVTELSVGRVTFSLVGLDEETFQSLSIKGFEVHGEFLEISRPLEILAEGRGSISWDTYSFDFTVFQAWVCGLTIEQKEDVISDVISWHEEIENAAVLDLNNFKRSA